MAGEYSSHQDTFQTIRFAITESSRFLRLLNGNEPSNCDKWLNINAGIKIGYEKIIQVVKIKTRGKKKKKKKGKKKKMTLIAETGTG